MARYYLPTKIAIFPHLVAWELETAELQLSDEMVLVSTRGTRLADLYDRLAEQELVDGDALVYPTAVVVSRVPLKPFGRPWRDPHGDIELIAAIITVAVGAPLLLLEAVGTMDDFATAHDVYEIYAYEGPSEEIGEVHKAIDGVVAERLKAYWSVVTPRRGLADAESRVLHALTQFFAACRSQQAYVSCVNLAMALETLFSPNAHVEIAHQVAYNVAWFLGSDPSERRALYAETKRFYNLRSSLVHGGLPNTPKIFEPTAQMIGRMIAILQRILSSSDVADLFDDDSRRMALFDGYLFE